MNWIFVDVVDWDYDVTTAFNRPLGGSQSALSYLAIALAARGHTVTTLTGTRAPRLVHGVRCLFHHDFPTDIFAASETVVVLLNRGAAHGIEFRGIIPGAAKLVLWTQHAHDESAMQILLDPACAAAWDQFVCVSDWQRTRLHQHLQLPIQRMEVLRNAVGPRFEGMFHDAADFVRSKPTDVRLAYTSTPFRGLDVLLSCFQKLRHRQPTCTLDVFSSMQVYFQTEDQDRFQKLYQLCAMIPGVRYHGSVSQSQLAQEMRGVHVLAYPNTFPETSCIAVMEALAAGALVVTSDLGGLPETCAGWARLLPPISEQMPREQFARDFVAALDAALTEMQADWTAFMDQRYKQVQAVNAQCTWSVRAAEWEAAATRWLQD